MAEFKVGRTKASTADLAPAALANDCVAITRDSILQWKMEGRVFYAQQGDAGTKLNFAEAAYDEDQPQFALRVPQGVVCIPVAMNIVVEDLVSTENHIIWSTTTNDIGVTSTKATILTPVNYRRDSLRSPMCAADSLYTQNATAATGLIETHRWYHPFASAAVTDTKAISDHMWTIEDPDMPILVGPATLQMHCYGATVGPQGFGQYSWIEFTTEELGLD
jgi:hypothetical protein